MRIIKSFQNRLIFLLINHPRIILFLFFLLTVSIGWQSRNFKIDASSDTLLTRNNKLYLKTKEINQLFAPQEFLLVAYQPKQHSVFSDQTFQNINKISNRIRKLPRVESTRSILTVPLFLGSKESIITKNDISSQTIQNNNFSNNQISEIFKNHPIYENLLINHDQSATAIQVLFKSNPQLKKIEKKLLKLQKKSLNHSLTTEEKINMVQLKKQVESIQTNLDKIRYQEIKTIRKYLAEFEEHANLYLGGIHVLGYQLIQIIKNDLIVFGSIITIIICIILFILFRSIRWVILPVVCCLCSVLITIGLLATIGIKTTVISSNFIAIQLILTLALVIHLMVQYKENLIKHYKWNQKKILKKTLRQKLPASFYAGISTSVGFGSLILSGIQPVISFGWMMVLAMIISILTSLVLFPAIMILTSKNIPKKTTEFVKKILDFSLRVTLQHSRKTIFTFIIISVLCVFGLFLLKIDNSFIDYFHDTTKVHNELTFIDKEFGGSTPLDIVIKISEQKQQNGDLILSSSTIQKINNLQNDLSQHKAVGKILSLDNFIRLAKKVNNDKPLTEYELTALYWTIEDSVRDNLIGSFFLPKELQVRFSLRVQDTYKNIKRSSLIKKIKSDITRNGFMKKQFTLTNMFVLYQDILNRFISSQILTLGIVFIVLFSIFYVIFKSLKLACICVVPNLFATIGILGIMGWLGIALDLMTITIAAIAMSIAVDDTIHYVHRYLKEIQSGSEQRSIQNTHYSVGYAIVYTSLIIMAGFSLLVFSDFVPSIFFGILTALSMALALFADLTLLPVLLSLFILPSKQRTS